MQHLVLSDHAADQRNAAELQRQQAYAVAMAQYQVALAQRHAQADALKDRSRQAWADRKVGAWLGSWAARFVDVFCSWPSEPQLQDASRNEVVWSVGSEGEKRAEVALRSQLDDSWILVSGYHNAGGEMDALLIGPAGLLAMEIKNINGTVHCEGDRWTRDKYDNYGNLVESGVPIKDKRGRSPSMQVNATADRLRDFLATRGAKPHLTRAVLLVHDKSELGQISQPTVHLVATLPQLTRATIDRVLASTTAPCDPQAILTLVKKDHAYHAQRRANTGRRPDPLATT